MKKAHKALKQFFGYDTFRPMQEEIIQSVLDGNDSLVLMPTGGGKSMCFQIPAIIMDGTCIVVSPLIALMKDQVEGLKANGVPAAFMNSSMSWDEEQVVERLCLDGKLRLLYASPEKLLSQAFQSFLHSIKVSSFAIDEAHCISSWGHDFRPEYTQMKFLKDRFPKVPIIALTATADKITRRDIAKQLSLADPKVYVASFDRPNLKLSVLPGRNRYQLIEAFVKNRPNQSGIIYCLSRKSTEDIAGKLKKAGYNAAHYHAGLAPDIRSRTQEKFINDEVPIIVATIAFGMGIDKSNVRWVVHYNLPKNLEGYYQEIGRAGRDSLPSDTLLFYSFADVILQRKFIEDSEHQEVPLNKLERMQQYADAQVCRRKILLNYFGEHTQKDCGNCDVCENPPQHFDGTVIAQKALSAVKRTGEKASISVLIDVLRGASNQNVFENDYQKIKTYGAGRDISYQDWQQYILQMLNQGLVEIAYDDRNSLRLTPASIDILFSKKKVNLVQPSVQEKIAKEKAKKTKKKSKAEVYEEDLFQALRALRKRLAAEAKVPPYLVFSDASLKSMAAERPVSEPEFLQISGVGDRKLKLYGEVFINEILSFIQDQNSKGNKAKGSTQLVTWDFYSQGLSVEEIAESRSLNPTTIKNHLAQLYEEGKGVKIFDFVGEKEAEQVIEAINEIGDEEGLKVIFDHLNGEISYDKIRMAISYYRVNVK